MTVSTLTQPFPRRPRLGMYVRGKGTGGPWRYVHSILSAVDPDEFEVILFSDLDSYPPRSHVRAVAVHETAPTNPSRECRDSQQLQSHSRQVLRVVRRTVPRSVKIIAGFYRDADRLAASFRSERIDILHTNYTGCEESPVAARRASVPLVVGTFHVDPSYDLSGKRSGIPYRLLECVSNHALDHAIAVSHQTKRDWIRRTKLPESRVTTIHNGIDSDHFRRRLAQTDARRMLRLPTDVPIIGGVGRLDEVKGFAYLLDAIAAVAQTQRDVFLAIGGEGPQRAALELQAERLGIGSRVRFLGFMSDVQPLLDALDVFVLPSLCETLGYAHLEAMATGIPAVGTLVGGVPEVIVHGQTGLLVPPRDSAALESALIYLLGSPDLRRRMGEAGRRRVQESFTERNMVDQTIAVYRDLAQRKFGHSLSVNVRRRSELQLTGTTCDH